MQAQIKSNGSNASGKLINNIRSFTKDNSLNVTMPIYGKFVDEGTDGAVGKKGIGDRKRKYKMSELTGRKLPPINAITPWAKSKGINPWAVAMSIKRFGTKPHPFVFKFSEVVYQNRKLIQDTIGKEIGDNIEQTLKQEFKY